MTADEERRKAHETLFANINDKLDTVLANQNESKLSFSLKVQALEKDKADRSDVDELKNWRARWAGVCIGLSVTATILATIRVSLLLFGD